MAKSKQKILVIKHDGIGEFVSSTGAFEAIRKKHKNSHITLLTEAPMRELAEKSGYFDEVWVDKMIPFWNLPDIFSFSKELRERKFEMIYDLECSVRSSMYFRIMGRNKPKWSGVVEWCTYPHNARKRKYMHILDKLDEQLKIAGIKRIPKPDVSWLEADISKFNLPEAFALIVAGCREDEKGKRWHKEGFVEVSQWLFDNGITPVFVGSDDDNVFVKSIIRDCRNIEAINLVNKTSLGSVAELARYALIAIGNETGPLHLIAATYCPSVMLFSKYSMPELCSPIGKHVFIFAENDLKNLDARDVTSLAEDIIEAEILDSTEKQPKTQSS